MGKLWENVGNPRTKWRFIAWKIIEQNGGFSIAPKKCKPAGNQTWPAGESTIHGILSWFSNETFIYRRLLIVMRDYQRLKP